MTKQSWLFWAMLLPLVASCSPPPGRYQKATVSTSDGRLCFGIPDTRENRSEPPEIASIGVSAAGQGLYPMWERVFMDEHVPEPALPPDQCMPYGSGPHPAPPLQVGAYYQVVLSGYTPDNPDNGAMGKKRVFKACFHLHQSVDDRELKPIVVTCGDVPPSSLPPS